MIIFIKLLLMTQVNGNDPDNSLCNKSPVSNFGRKPVPTLPNQFHAIFEANILQKSYTVYQEEYYDYYGNRGVIITTRYGKVIKMITDFASYRVHQIDLSSGKCVVKDLRHMQSTLFNFTKTATGGQVKGLADIFKFSSKFNETYLGTTKVRGIPADYWTTCLHVEELKATFIMDFYFSQKTYDILGSQIEIPLRATIKGQASNVNQTGAVLNGVHTFDHVYDFIKYEPGPIKDQSVFQIPMGIICTGQTDKKPMPIIADKVSFGIEKFDTDKTTDPIYMQIDYDFSSKMARLEFSKTPSGDLRKAYGNDGITLLQDYYLGIEYAMDAVYGNCTMTEISDSFSDYTTIPSYKLPPEMRHPIALLEVNYSSMVYQGQKMFRGLQVEAWGRLDNVTNFVHEIYFLQNQTDFYNSGHMMAPVGIYTSVLNTKTGLKFDSIFNIYNYQPNRINPSRFDIQRCYRTNKSYTMVFMIIDTDNSTAMLSKKLLYINYLHQFLSKMTKVRPTRILDLDIYSDSISIVGVYFVLLDKSPIPEGRRRSMDKTLSLQEAYSNLETAIQNGVLWEVENQKYSIQKTSLHRIPMRFILKNTENEKKQGYSSGSMAGLGIGMLITGIICGLVGAYVINRRRDLPVPYELQ